MSQKFEESTLKTTSRGPRALVAGGAGFVGSHLCELLLAKGYSVLAVDSFITGRKQNLAGIFSNPDWNRRFQLVEMDIINLDLKHSAFNEPISEIYNLASPASPIDFDRMPIFIMMVGSLGHRNLLDLGKLHNSRVLFTSSSEIYGDPEIHPQREDYVGHCNSVGPRSCYDEAKRFGEALSRAYHLEKQVETRVARIFNTYGPRMRPEDGRILPSFFSQAFRSEPITLHGDGSQTRSFCFVSDLAAGLFALMQSSETTPVNIGNPNEITVKQMAEMVKSLTRSASPIVMIPGRPEDPKRRKPDITRARERIGWEPRVPLDEGLQLSLEYFRQAILG
jgi:nucleoside-diphosphate-sugar epimerase